MSELELGHMSDLLRPTDEASILNAINRMYWDAAQKSSGTGGDRITHPEFYESRYSDWPVHVDVFMDAARDITSAKAIFDKNRSPRRCDGIAENFVFNVFDARKHKPSLASYLDYLAGVSRELERETQPYRFPAKICISEADRRAHTLITGGSRMGKSELLKRLIHHYVAHPELGGVLVVDPHGEMAAQIARWQEFAGDGMRRLVYLDAKAGEAVGRVPALNPLVRGSASDDELSHVADQLANALSYFGGDGEGHTPQMHRLARFVLRVQLGMKGSTLMDTMSGLTLQGKRGQEASAPALPAFVAVGRDHPDEVVQDFFRTGFDGESYASTRDALKRRLTNALEVPVFRRMMTAPEPLDLEAELNAGKVVVVNCGTAGAAVANTVGQFMMAQVAAIGARRLANPDLKRMPVHVFVDEATRLMSPPFVEILEQFAKTRIWLTMAQQGAGEGATRDFIGRVTRNTGLKFIGASGKLGELEKFVDVSLKELPALERGQFVVVKTGAERDPLLLDTRPSPLADDAGAMSAAEWRAVLDYQLATYYRPTAPPAPPKPAEPESAPAAADRWRE